MSELILNTQVMETKLPSPVEATTKHESGLVTFARRVGHFLVEGFSPATDTMNPDRLEHTNPYTMVLPESWDSGHRT